MLDEVQTQIPSAREIVADLQLAQLRVRLGLAPTLEAIALDSERRFLILDILGVGGMGVVFLGHDTTLERRVALKVLHSRMSAVAQIEARLMREAKILATLQDRNILVVYDVGRTTGGALFLATQHIDGQTLRAWQAGRSANEVLAAYLEAGRGLAAAHQREVVHRDFKPENVLVELGSTLRVYVGDFGLADGPKRDELAQHSIQGRFGTPAYMAPEQLRREPATARSDQYSFCIALWEAYTGSRPSNAASLERPVHMPRWLYRLLVVGLSPSPRDRHASLDLLLTHIERGRLARKRALAVAAALVLFGLCLGLGYGFGTRRPTCGEVIAPDETLSTVRMVMLHEHLASIPVEYAPQTAASIIDALQSNTELRHELERATCETLPFDPDDSRVDRQIRCLEHWRTRTTEQIHALSKVDTASLANAWDLLEPLETLALVCQRGGVAAPLDREVRDALTLAENASISLDHDHALNLARGALSLAQTRGQPCWERSDVSRELGHAHHRLGRVHMLAGRPELAREEFLVALGHGRACDDAELQATTNLYLAQLYSLQLGRIDAAQLAIVDARGTLDALNEPSMSPRRARLYESEGFIALTEQRHNEAIAAYRRALEALGDPLAHPLHASNVFLNLGAALDQAGQSAEARLSYERAREIVAIKLGLTHPTAQSHLRRIQFNDGIALMHDQPDQARQMLAPLMAAPELPIRVKAISAWLTIVFDGTTTPDQLVHTHELIQALRADPNLEPQVRAEGLTIAGHLLVGAGDAAGFELMREALVVWKERFPNDPSTVQAAVRFAQALHDAGRDDEARDACRAVRRLQVAPPEHLAVELAALERELGT